MNARPGYYLGENRILTLTDRGDRMYLDANDMYVTPAVLCYGAWEPETTRTLEEHLRPGMNWVDVGANVGYFTIIGHRLVMKGGRTWAFEASEMAHRFLVENFELNWLYAGFTLEQKAVYSQSTRLQFTVPERLSTGATIGNVPDADYWRVRDKAQRYEVDAVSLDDYFMNSVMLPDFVKMDIEGAEYFALLGSRRVIAAKPNIKIVLEWNPTMFRYTGVDPRQFVELIGELGFSCQLAEETRRSVTFDELLTFEGSRMILLSRRE